MDFFAAIAAHIDWKIKLGVYLDSVDGSLKYEEVVNDSSCELGKWIYGIRPKYDAIPEFAALLRDHAEFHRLAGEIIRRVDQGHLDEARALLVDDQSGFQRMSNSIIILIQTLKNKTGY